MESLEGTCSRTTWNHVHHGGLDLSEISLTQELSNEIDNLVAALENLLDWVIHDQVEVALAVSGFLVEHVLFTITLGQHVQAVGKLLDCGWAHGELASLGAADEAFNSNDVSTLDSISQYLKVAFVIGSVAEKLAFLLVTLNINEDKLGTRLSHVHDTTCDGDLVLLFLHKHAIFGTHGLELSAELVNTQSAVELVGVGVHICVALSLEPVFTIVSVLGGIKLLLLFLLFLWLKSICFRLFSLLSGFLSVVFTLLLSLLELTLANLFTGGLIKVGLNLLFFFLLFRFAHRFR